MGFIPSASTVTVQAKLTNAGKKKLYQSIENQGGRFITKFALGDSDSNYVAIEGGAGPVDAGHVPDAGDFLSQPRSFAIYQGLYPPGVPVIFHNGNPGPETVGTIAIGANSPQGVSFDIRTEWPVEQLFEEEYNVSIVAPSTSSQERFESAFVYNLTDGTLALRYVGGLSLADIARFVGNDEGESDFYINIVGKQSRRFSRISMRIVL